MNDQLGQMPPMIDGTSARPLDATGENGSNDLHFTVIPKPTPTLSDVCDAAREGHGVGICMIPAADSGSKRPPFEWKKYQSERSTDEQIRRWYGSHTGLIAVCGKVSGNLEMFEFDNREAYRQFLERAVEVGLGELVDRIRAGYEEETPSGGIHWFYFCEVIEGNTLLAGRPGPPNEQGKDTVDVLIETRGEGGLAVVSPSFGKTHPTGLPYLRISGGFPTAVTISPKERESLWELARSFDELPKKVVQPTAASTQSKVDRTADEGTLPGDDYNERAKWEDVLEPNGWKKLFSRGDTTYWQRPGKSEGVSATTNHAGSDLLYVFTTSSGFKPEIGYSKFGAYSLLNHNEDHSAAAKDLFSKGFGTLLELDVKAIMARISAIVEAKDVEGLYSDSNLLIALAKLKKFDGAKFAIVKAKLKTIKGFSAEDFKAALKPPGAKSARGQGDAKPGAAPPGGGIQQAHLYPYEKKHGCFWALIGKGEAAEMERLNNFVARIASEITEDDGAEQKKAFLILGSLSNGRPLSAEVPSTEFNKMEWVLAKCGAEAIIEAGQRFRDHVRSAIQNESADVVRITRYLYVGWRKFEDGRWGYLHAGGAIFAEGSDPSVSVQLDGALGRYQLPDPPTGTEGVRVVRASLGMLRLGETGRTGAKAAVAALFAAVWRSAIMPANFTLQFVGASGGWKSSSVALAQQFYGVGMDEKNLPENWKSTVYSIETSQHRANCALLTIDDFVPSGSSRDVSDLHQKEETIFRNQGNLQSRHRMNADGSQRPDRNPRCLLASTGEDRVRNKSADARTLPLRFVKGDEDRGIKGTIDKDILSQCQADARNGLYAAAMASFLRWLAPRLDSIRIEMAAKVLEVRAEVTRTGDHPRAADIVAELIVGLRVFLAFAMEIGAMDKAEAVKVRDWVRDGLMEAVADSRQDDPAQTNAGDRFLQLIASALASGQAYLADMEGDVPDGMEAACGWKQELKWQGNDVGQRPMWVTWTNAERIGWTDGQKVYLESTVSYGMARKFSDKEGETFPVQKETVHRLLFEAGMLAETDSRNQKEGRGRLTARKSISKKQVNVLVLKCSSLWPDHEQDPKTQEAPAEPPQEGEV